MLFSSESAIRVCSKLYQLTQDHGYLDEINRYMQTQKAMNLYEHLQDRYAISYSGIPESVIENKKSIRREIASYKQLLAEFSASGNLEIINHLNAEKLSLEDKYDAFISKLEQNYLYSYQARSRKSNYPLFQAISQEYSFSLISDLLSAFRGSSYLGFTPRKAPSKW